MNQYEMVIGIILIVSIAGIIRAKMGISRRRDRHGNEQYINDVSSSAEARRLQEEVRTLKDRIQVLERVITENHSSSSLDREIEKLRDERK